MTDIVATFTVFTAIALRYSRFSTSLPSKQIYVDCKTPDFEKLLKNSPPHQIDQICRFALIRPFMSILRVFAKISTIDEIRTKFSYYISELNSKRNFAPLTELSLICLVKVILASQLTCEVRKSSLLDVRSVFCLSRFFASAR